MGRGLIFFLGNRFSGVFYCFFYSLRSDAEAWINLVKLNDIWTLEIIKPSEAGFIGLDPLKNFYSFSFIGRLSDFIWKPTNCYKRQNKEDYKKILNKYKQYNTIYRTRLMVSGLSDLAKEKNSKLVGFRNLVYDYLSCSECSNNLEQNYPDIILVRVNECAKSR